MTNQLPLAEGFAQLSHEQWQDLAAKALNRRRPEDKWFDGPTAEKRLVTHTVDGLSINPLYTKPETANVPGLPGSMPFTRGSGVSNPNLPWEVCQAFDNPCGCTTAKEIITDLEGGVSAVWLRFGAGQLKLAKIDKILADVALELIAISVSGDGAAGAFLAYAEQRGLPKNHLRGNLGFDPIGGAALSGGVPVLTDAIAAARTCVADYPGVSSLIVDVLGYHNAGAGEVEELAAAIATGIAYLRALVDAGFSPDEAASQIQFRVSATADEFLTIASLRALRRLWARVCEVAGVTEAKRGAYQHVVTSERMITRDDPWVNILRGTVATFAAAVGGAEAITVLPFDQACGYPDELARRVARNTSVLLAEETHLGAVIDPAGGSWYVESLTDQLAETAWVLVQEIEGEGGIEAALASGSLAAKVAATAAERAKRLAVRKQDITGVNQFPMLHESLLERKARPVALATGAFAPKRDAEMFEALRDRSRAHAAATGENPKVTLACLGARRDFGGREMFTSNVLLIAGIDAELIEAADVDELKAKIAGVKFAAICSSAKVYADWGQAAVTALREAGANPVYIAGSPAELGEGGSVDGNFALGKDVVTQLNEILDLLGVAK